MTDRATSTMLSYALTLSIITLLVSGVFVAAGGYVEDQHERTIYAELDVVGNRLAADLAAVDRLALAAPSSTARLTIDLPTRVAGAPYRIALVDLGDDVYAIDLSTTEPAAKTTVTVKLASGVSPSNLAGGDVTITYSGGDLEVERG